MGKRPTLESVEVRGVVVPLRRPVVSKVGQFAEWPLLLVDARTSDGVVGRAYLEPYLAQSLRYVAPAVRDLAAACVGGEALSRRRLRKGSLSFGPRVSRSAREYLTLRSGRRPRLEGSATPRLLPTL